MQSKTAHIPIFASGKPTNLQRSIKWLSVIILLGSVLFPAGLNATAAQQPVVNALLFYSPSCGHCHYVINEVLPPIIEEYGDQLTILAVNVTQAEGQVLYQSMFKYFQLTQDRMGVPALVIGDTVLVGSGEIPEQFPGLIEQGLAAGGVYFPNIPGLAEMLEAQGLGGMAEPAKLSLVDKFNQDRVGNSLSVAVLLLMLVTLVVALVRFFRTDPTARLVNPPAWLFPVLVIAGIAVAGYLSYVEITRSEAVCGPVGDCNTVQSSSYSRLFGVLPVGVFGLVGYLLILITWGIGRFSRQSRGKLPSLVVSGLVLFGLIFMIYLTFLEPFVIGATCAWCLTSALIMTLLMWLSMDDGLQAWDELFN